MPTPLMDFETNFRTAETLLKVYRLLDSPDGPKTQHDLMQGVRDLLMARDDEELILLINELFLGVVRENADVRPAVFKKESLCMLLRQAIVASCSALDVYFPALLREYLPLIIAVKQRNFIPNDKIVKDFFRNFRLSIDEILRVINATHPENELSILIDDYLKTKNFSNSQGVEVSLLILDIQNPWDKISEQLGQDRTHLTRTFNALVKRRNEIIHNGDRSKEDLTGPPQEIQFPWTNNHITAIKNIVFAADELVTEQMNLYSHPEFGVVE